MSIIGCIWWCEDEICDCTQPEIVRQTPQPGGFYKFERLWEGTFVSGPGEDRSMQTVELARAAARFGLVPHPKHEDYYVEKPVQSDLREGEQGL